MNSEILTSKTEITENELNLINSYTRRKFGKDELYTFSVILCDNEIDRDYERFSVDALIELSKLFVGKTGIFDHSMKGHDQVARIYYTEIKQVDGKQTLAGEQYVQLFAKGYMIKTKENSNLIDEIDAGIKKEVSVSCSMASSKCSICGAELKNGGCEHIYGKKYGNKICHKVLSQATDAYEFSFVAVPCQRSAGVIKSFNFNGRKVINLENILNVFKSIDSEITISKNDGEEIAGYIEKLKILADVGQEFQKGLQKEVVKLCPLVMPEMDINIFKGITDVMTLNELKAFKGTFEKMASHVIPVERQFNSKKAENNQNNNEFKI